MLQHYLSAGDLGRSEVEALLDRAASLKAEFRANGGGAHAGLPLQGKTLALVFEKPSLRTRVAFEAGMTQLGGHGSYLSANDIDMGGRESVPDVARNLSRWVQAIAARVFKHTTVETLARYASVPVINALSDREHPCQALADMLTLRERFGALQGLRLAYVGDGNNVCHSLMITAANLGVEMRVASPKGYEPVSAIVAEATRRNAMTGGKLLVTNDPREAVEGATAVYTDVWASMGEEHEAEERKQVFQAYQVNAQLMTFAASGAFIMHDLPAHRGEEVTDDPRYYNVALAREDSIERHFMDTLEGGKWLNDQDLAWTLVTVAQRRIRELENRWGCFFDRNPDGTIHQKAFAGQTFDRTVHKGDLTGIEIINRLAEQAWARGIERLEEHRAVALIRSADGSRLSGVLLIDIRSGGLVFVQARAVLLGTGGVTASS